MSTPSTAFTYVKPPYKAELGPDHPDNNDPRMLNYLINMMKYTEEDGIVPEETGMGILDLSSQFNPKDFKPAFDCTHTMTALHGGTFFALAQLVLRHRSTLFAALEPAHLEKAIEDTDHAFQKLSDDNQARKGLRLRMNLLGQIVEANPTLQESFKDALKAMSRQTRQGLSNSIAEARRAAAGASSPRKYELT